MSPSLEFFAKVFSHECFIKKVNSVIFPASFSPADTPPRPSLAGHQFFYGHASLGELYFYTEFSRPVKSCAIGLKHAHCIL